MAALMKKRGFADIQANWVFAIIVGAMLLLLFAGIAKKQIDRSSYEESVRAASYIAKILTGDEARFKVALPDKQAIEISCEEEELTVGGIPAKWPPGIVAFGKNMNAKEFTIIRLDQKMPFLYARATILIPDDLRIILAFNDSSGQTAKAITDAFAGKVAVANLDDFDIKSSMLAIILDSSGQPSRAVGLSEDIFFLAVDNGAMKPIGTAPYINDDLVIAAIANGFDGYSCSLERLAERAGYTAGRYTIKARALESGNCTYPVNDLAIMAGNSTLEQIRNITAAAKRIEAQNNASCEVLY
jgi:hypothetical protein